jgi:hypothetical protein
MCPEIPVIPVNKVVDTERIMGKMEKWRTRKRGIRGHNRKKWKALEDKRHKEGVAD